MAFSTIIIAALLLITVAQAQDPTCSTGLRVANACCPAECGTCGGPTCGPRGRMLGTMCCIGAIKNSENNCLTVNAPCMITTRDPDFVAGSDVADPTCENGLTQDDACCPPECSVCGGSECEARGALISSSCCPSEINAGTRDCSDTGAPCKLMDSTMPMETPTVVETPMPPMETPTVVETPMPPMETPTMVETPMPQETPVVDETPMPSMEVPVETAAPLPAVCTRMRSKFLGGCFCYLVFSREIRVRMARKFRPLCREIYGPRKKILSLVFTCRRFTNGSKASTRVTNLINRLNRLIPRCTTDVPLIAIKG